MEKEKDLLLSEALDNAVTIGFGLRPAENLEDYFSDRLLVIGTAVNERYWTLEGVRTLIQMQKEQGKGMEINFTRKEFYRDIRPNSNVAVIAEDITVAIKMDAETMSFDVRSTAVLEYAFDKWKLIHWHASKPDLVQSDDDTFGVEELRQKAKELEILVAERTWDLRLKNEELEAAMKNLEATQFQLIHSEKMASLGELTAGIAHEIQNPLNFVNNFSEVSNELIDEMKEELTTGNKQQAIALADDIKQNLVKIVHHGKRADTIVKGMLQHSRSSSGQKEPTDINALCDEYLRLAYHGLRAKDKSFNASFTTDFDPAIGNVNMIPQDIGRVILNLITNAFYAVDEKKRTGPNENASGYEPAVFVSTKKMNDKIEIKVSDNGNGIPQNVLHKIFQPFFTTKPTGQGTGLGLSLSYDIVKAHGGEMKVETKEEAETTFIVQLPTN